MIAVVSILLAACAAPVVPTAAPVTPSATLQTFDAALPALVIVNGTLIDGTGSDPIKDAVLVIQGERIVVVGPRSSIGIPAGAQIIDVQGGNDLARFLQRSRARRL